jgi:hypothetical protein
MSIPPDITHVIEPFVGTGDLLKFIDPAKADYTIETYDIDPKYEGGEAGHVPTRQTTREVRADQPAVSGAQERKQGNIRQTRVQRPV